MKLTDLFLNRWLYRESQQNLETKDAIYDASNVIPAAVPAVAAGGAAQDINTSNVTINGAQLEPGTFPVTVLNVSNWGWTQSCVFNSDSSVQVSWALGIFTSADGTSYVISAGNTGTMSAKNYIYLDLNVSITAYQKTTTPGDAVGVGKVLIGVANKATAPALASFTLTEATQITGDNILANTIDASKITTGQLVVGTNVGQGTAVTSGGVTTIIGNTVTTGYVNALNITAQYVVASVSLSSPTITGGTIAIGSGNSIFKADSNGIYLGNATFASAPFRVNMLGEVTATKITISTTDSSYTGTPIAAAYIGNLSTAKITSGTITIGGTAQPSLLELIQSTAGGGGTTTALLTWKDTAGGTLRGKIWADSSGYMGYNAIGGYHYFYTNNNENVVIVDGSQTVFNNGISCRGALNVGINGTPQVARMTSSLYFDATVGVTTQEIWGATGGQMIYNSANYHYFNVNSSEKLKCSSIGTSISNGFLYLPILTTAQAATYQPAGNQNGACYYNSDTNRLRMYGNGSFQTVFQF